MLGCVHLLVFLLEEFELLEESCGEYFLGSAGLTSGATSPPSSSLFKKTTTVLRSRVLDRWAKASRSSQEQTSTRQTEARKTREDE